MRGGRWRVLVVALVGVLWLGITVSGAAVALVDVSFGDFDCRAPGSDSNYGRKDWSIAPPGPRCVWTRQMNGFAAEEEPSGLWSLWLAAVIVSGAVAVTLAATLTPARAPRRTAAPPPGS